MSSVDEIKAAAMKLPPADKLDLYRQLDESSEVREWRLAELRREIQKGVASLERGEFTEHGGDSLRSLREEIKARGRLRLRDES